jgi:peptidyl-tRNA hydrolase, PTH1 family
MKLVVGLGNPGSRYEGTRHNVGYGVVDLLAKSPRASRFQERFSGSVSELIENQAKILLVKPLTFMNRSGSCVRQFVDFYQLPLEDVLVVCDDVHLPLGKLRVRKRGSAGGHNGLRDIQAHLGTPEYARLRIGIGGAQPGVLIDHVLSRFQQAERPVIKDAMEQGAQAVMVWAERGAEECMNLYNG